MVDVKILVSINLVKYNTSSLRTIENAIYIRMENIYQNVEFGFLCLHEHKLNLSFLVIPKFFGFQPKVSGN